MGLTDKSPSILIAADRSLCFDADRRFWKTQKSDQLHPRMGDQLPPESVINIKSESVINFGQNTQSHTLENSLRPAMGNEQLRGWANHPMHFPMPS